MRQQAFFHPNHKDDGKLQPFGRMQSYKSQGVFILFVIVLLADEANLLQEEAKRILSRFQLIETGTELSGYGA